MEPKTKAASARDAVAFVQSNYPPGTTMKHIGTGAHYIIGTKHGAVNFWMMSIGESKKGLVSAQQIRERFAKVNA